VHEILRSTEELEAFAPEWERLWKADPQATPFQSSAWLIPWWRQFGQPGLRCLCIHVNGICEGFLPFYVYPNAEERQLLLLGAGTSDYLDGVFSSLCKVEDVRHALERLMVDQSWDVMIPTQLRPESKLLQAMSRSRLREDSMGKAAAACRQAP